jgi:hypothetical protein
MTKRRIIRAFLYPAVLVISLLALPWIPVAYEVTPFAFRIAAAILLADLWKTSPRLTGFKLALNRILLCGLTTEVVWVLLNSIRGFTYDAAIESRSRWQSLVFGFVIEIQTPIFWIGVALAAIFILVLIAFAISTAIHHHRTNQRASAPDLL